MRRIFGCVPFLLLITSITSSVGTSSVSAQEVVIAPPAAEASAGRLIQLAQATPARATTKGSYAKIKEKYNTWTIGLAAGLYEGAGTRMASELAKALNDDENLRILPLLTSGLFGNVYDLLYLKGIDIAIVNGDIMEHFKNSPEAGVVTPRINYIANLYVGEVHILVRPEINSIYDLAGKVVNFNTKSSATGYTGPLVFERLGIKVIPNYDAHLKAVAEMTSSERVAAVAFASSKPLQQFNKAFPPGFKFIPIPYTKKLDDLYLPANLTSADYPQLIRPGERVSTIAVPTLLAAYDWPADHDRHRRMVRFIDNLFKQLPTLQTTAGNHPKWKELSLAGTVPGWKRYPAMQKRLDAAIAEMAGGAGGANGQPLDPGLAREIARKYSNDPDKQDQLVKDFLEWAKTRK